jgi:hypothetical protein
MDGKFGAQPNGVSVQLHCVKCRPRTLRELGSITRNLHWVPIHHLRVVVMNTSDSFLASSKAVPKSKMGVAESCGIFESSANHPVH